MLDEGARVVLRRFCALLPLLFALEAGSAAADKFVAASGPWNQASTYGTSCSSGGGAGVPGPSETIFLCSGKTLSAPCGTTLEVTGIVATAGNYAAGTGLVVDGSQCAAGQVPRLISHAPYFATQAFLDVSAAAPGNQVVEIRGRAIYQDERLGSFDHAPGVQPACGSGATDCARVSWSGAAPPGVQAALDPSSGGERLIWLEEGQHHDNVLFVRATGAGPAIYVDAGYLDDYFGSGGPVGGAPVVPSLKVARPAAGASLVAVDADEAPLRTYATITNGTMFADQIHEGACLWFKTSGNAYRIAGTDSTANPDRLWFDPYVELAPVDQVPQANVYIAPCYRAGTRFSAFEPVVIAPSVQGGNSTAVFALNGQCPAFTRVLFDHATSSYTGDADLNGNVVNFAHTDPCKPFDQVVIGGMRSPAPYGVGAKDTLGLEISRIAITGFYQEAYENIGTHYSVGHCYLIFDSREIDSHRNSCSWQNNEVLFSPVENIDDSRFEGMTGRWHQTNNHDIYQLPADQEEDGSVGIRVQSVSGDLGYVSFEVYDNLLWHIGGAAIVVSPDNENDPESSAIVRDNVIAYTLSEYRVRNDFNLPAAALMLPSPLARAHPSSIAVNNVVLSSLRRAGRSEPARGIVGAGGAFYNYVGDAVTGLLYQEGIGGNAGTAPEIVGLLWEPGGISGLGHYGISIVRANYTGTLRVRDLLIRNHAHGGSAVASVAGVLDVSPVGGTGASWDVEHATIHMGSPLYDASGDGVTTNPGDAAFVWIFPRAQPAGSRFAKILCATGDSAAAAPGERNAWCFDAQIGLAPAPMISDVSCSAAAVGNLLEQKPCLRNPGLWSAANAVNVMGPITGLGFFSSSDLRLRTGALAAQPDRENPEGARFAGVLQLSQAMEWFGLSLAHLQYRAQPEFQPDYAALPAVVQSLYPPPAPQTVGSGTPQSCTESALDAALAGGGEIRFACGAAAHAIAVTATKVIDAASAMLTGDGIVTLDGGNQRRLFQVNDGASLFVDGITLTGGSAASGAAIRNDGYVALLGARFTGNEATNDGGGAILNTGLLVAGDAEFVGNLAAGDGGAIHDLGGSLSVTNSLFANNGAQRGGSISHDSASTLLVSNSLFEGNTAVQDGGAIHLAGGPMELQNSTLTDNQASRGGALYTERVANLENATLSANRGTEGGALYVEAQNPRVINTIVAGSHAPDGVSPVADCGGASVVSLGFNLMGDASCNGIGADLVSTAPQLGPLAYNGGPTRTLRPIAGSPAIDAGSNPNCPATDQRGEPRPVDGDLDTVADCDIGAVEIAAPEPAATALAFAALAALATLRGVGRPAVAFSLVSQRD